MTSTRDRIVKAAQSLFYREGLHAISMDAIAEKAGFTKRTLYYHFKSKDDLIEAYLRDRDERNIDAFKLWFSEASGDTSEKIRAVFFQLSVQARKPSWKGCSFLRTAAELISLPGHPALKVARDHKVKVERWFQDCLQSSHVANSEMLSRQLRVLLDGAFSSVLLTRDATYLEVAGEAAQMLVRINTAV